jgi:hypothetical protein
MRRRRRAPAALLVALLATAVAGCGIGAPQVSFVTDVGPTPSASESPAIAQTRLLVQNALGAASYILTVPTVPFRPPESPMLATAPRAVYQVALPTDPTHGYIVIYEFPDTQTAYTAGQEMAGYLASGPGRVQFPPDTKHVLQLVGTTLIFNSWSPANSPGPDGARIQQILGTVGQSIPIPS